MAETMLYPGIAFSPQATLTNNIGAADTIISVSDVSAFPTAPNLATIGTDEEGETILYTAKTESALSGCQRGIEGTARSWMAGELIGRNFTAKDHNDLIAAASETREAATAAKNAAEAAQNAAEEAEGKEGPPGKTAYEYAVDGGYTGTETEFQSLIASGPWLPLTMSKQTSPTDFYECTITPATYFGVPQSFGNLDARKYGLKFSAPIIAEINANGQCVYNVGTPYRDTDAANKGYVDSKVSAAKTVETYVFTVSGPIAANETFNLSYSGLETDPFSGNTIFFGQPIQLLSGEKYQFEVIDYIAECEWFDGKTTHNGTITIKALTEIPEGVSVTILWAWT